MKRPSTFTPSTKDQRNEHFSTPKPPQRYGTSVQKLMPVTWIASGCHRFRPSSRNRTVHAAPSPASFALARHQSGLPTNCATLVATKRSDNELLNTVYVLLYLRISRRPLSQRLRLHQKASRQLRRTFLAAKYLAARRTQCLRRYAAPVGYWDFVAEFGSRFAFEVVWQPKCFAPRTSIPYLQTQESSLTIDPAFSHRF
ncbi:MAG: hypothetical protein JWP89_6960 [Schlesneria sp.]|nr:hypothetical protein [Schlesneria sp.]